MAKVNLGVQLEVNTRNIQGWRLGTEAALIKDEDINKLVALDTTQAGTLRLAGDGDEIRGFIASIEPHTADGATFGSVVVHAAGVRHFVTGTGLAVGDLVVSAAQTAAGVANDPALGKMPLNDRGLTKVKKGTPATFKWQVISLKGNLALIEAI